MKKYVFFFFVISFLLTGCGNSSDDHHHVKELPTAIPIDVEIEIPSSITVQEPITISAIVTQEGEYVDDASEVLFEIWLSGQDDHEMIEGVHQGAGKYSIEKSFNERGTYFVIAHVTARNMHNMPKIEVVVE